jgi:hypothetical protein
VKGDAQLAALIPVITQHKDEYNWYFFFSAAKRFHFDPTPVCFFVIPLSLFLAL